MGGIRIIIMLDKTGQKTKTILFGLLTSCFLLNIVCLGDAYAKPGTSQDPLVTKGYVDTYISNQLDQGVNNQIASMTGQLENLRTRLEKLAAESNPFTDTKGHWALASIRYLKARGIIAGFADGTFQPNGKVTRAQLAVMLVRAKGLKVSVQPKQDFKDVPSSYWAAKEIAAAREAGIINGYPDGTFAPSQPVTREQIAGMVSKAFAVEPIRPDQEFTDIQQSWAKTAIINLAKAGIIGGYPNHTFLPKQSATRAEVSVILARALDPTKRLQN